MDGLWRVAKEEGPIKMFSGATAATSRAVFMTIGQLSFYDLFKDLLLNSGYFVDNPTTHFLSSLAAVCITEFMYLLIEFLWFVFSNLSVSPKLCSLK